LARNARLALNQAILEQLHSQQAQKFVGFVISVVAQFTQRIIEATRMLALARANHVDRTDRVKQ
jgi:hypothetical protein